MCKERVIAYIYKLEFLNGKVYIGKTKYPERRYFEHRNNAARGSRLFVHNAWRKYGDPDMTILAELFCEEFSYEVEKDLISEYNSVDKRFGYNSTHGGDGSRLSNEAQERQASTLRDTYLLGRISEENMEKIRQSGRDTMGKFWNDDSFADAREKKAIASREHCNRLNSDPEFIRKRDERNRSVEGKNAAAERIAKVNSNPYNMVKVSCGKAVQYAKAHKRPFTEIKFKKKGGYNVITAA